MAQDNLEALVSEEKLRELLGSDFAREFEDAAAVVEAELRRDGVLGSSSAEDLFPDIFPLENAEMNHFNHAQVLEHKKFFFIRTSTFRLEAQGR